MARSMMRSALAAAALAVAVPAGAQNVGSFCSGRDPTDATAWDCQALSPVPAQAWAGFENFSPLPGTPDPANPTMYSMVTGNANLRGGAKVYALKEGAYFALLIESDGVAALVDAPEGSFVKARGAAGPSASWLPESIDALLSDGTELKYIIYSHAHWDHTGGAGFVYDYFHGVPEVVASEEAYHKLMDRDARDPATPFGNNRGVPMPSETFAEEYELHVGKLKLKLMDIGGHQGGDIAVLLSKDEPRNAAAGIQKSVLMAVDIIFPGWSPFFSLAISEDTMGFFDAMKALYAMEFDVFVGGHLSRLGNKADVKTQMDFFEDILEGAALGVATVDVTVPAVATGAVNPASPNMGNSWLIFNEYFELILDVCVAHVLDETAVGVKWTDVLAGVEVTLRSHCNVLQSFIRVG